MTTSVPVYSATAKGTCFLEIIFQGKRLRVQPTTTGRVLNPFWREWLRGLILDRPVSGRPFNVTFSKNAVIIGSTGSPESYVETVRSIASVIVPLPAPPMKRQWNNTRTRLSWEFTKVPDAVNFSGLHLPRGVRLTTSYYTDVATLFRHQNELRSIGELARMVELYAALQLRDKKLEESQPALSLSQ